MSAAANLIVGIDSQSLVWGVRRIGTNQQLQRAKWLFEDLESRQAQVIVPAVALSEYLCPIDKADHAAVIAAITDRFLVMPFDALCSSQAAELFNVGNRSRAKGVPESRKVLRADSLIIATASRHGAKLFYSGDRDCRALAAHISTWEVRDVPDQPETLFEYGATPPIPSLPPSSQ